LLQSLEYSIVLTDDEFEDLVVHIPAGNNDDDDIDGIIWDWLGSQYFQHTYIENEQEHITFFSPWKPCFQNGVDSFGGDAPPTYGKVVMPSEQEIEWANKAFQELQATEEFKLSGIEVKMP
ncbi:hypothetical protein H0H93_015411, partial [Arthromyces matolae]